MPVLLALSFLPALTCPAHPVCPPYLPLPACCFKVCLPFLSCLPFLLAFALALASYSPSLLAFPFLLARSVNPSCLPFLLALLCLLACIAHVAHRDAYTKFDFKPVSSKPCFDFFDLVPLILGHEVLPWHSCCICCLQSYMAR